MYLIDAPIECVEQDQLGWDEIAREYVGQIKLLDPQKGLVVGLVGPWGSGKTSLVNLMREHFRSEPEFEVLDFNPWVFSGVEQLVHVFFREISAQLRIRHKKVFGSVADKIADVGAVFKPLSYLIPMPGATLVADVAQAGLNTVANCTVAERSFSEMREKVVSELKKVDHPIVVIIDDVDRLNGEEIREIFKLVRLTGSFPNVIYLLAFDHLRVARALSEGERDGSGHIEKIIQVPFSVPKISERVILSEFADRIAQFEGGQDVIIEDQKRWNLVYGEVVRPLVKNFRDLKRFLLSSAPTWSRCSGVIDPIDLMCLELLRVFRPGMIERFSDMRRVLTSPIYTRFGTDLTKGQAEIESLLNAFPGETRLLEFVLTMLFPATGQYRADGHTVFASDADWMASHRVAYRGILDFYLDKVEDSRIRASKSFEREFSSFVHRKSIEAFLNGLDLESTEICLELFEGSRTRFVPQMAVPCIVALLNCVGRVPPFERRHPFDLRHPDFTVMRIVRDLLLAIDSEAEREAAVMEVLGELNTYSAQYILLDLVGCEENSGLRLVGCEFAKVLMQKFAERVELHPPTDLSGEWKILHVYLGIRHNVGVPNLLKSADPSLLKAIIEGAYFTWRTAADDHTREKKGPDLNWEALVELFGDRDAVKSAAVKVKQVHGTSDALELVLGDDGL